MRRLSRWAFAGWLVVSAGGCAAITGLDSIQEQDCAPECGDGQAVDVTAHGETGGSSGGNADVSTTPDQSTGDDVATESSAPESSVNDAPHESSAGEAGKEAGAGDASEAGKEGGVAESGVDAPPEAAPESGTDSGCGTTNTIQNCGACGQSCSAGGTNGVNAGGAGCTGTTCLYQCQTGHLDCNASVGYDGDGCECNVTAATSAACCGTACPVEHSVGTGLAGAMSQNFYDCTPSGQYVAQLATDACAAYFGNSADCYLPGECTNQNDAGTGDFVVCGSLTATSECYCWEYQGPNIGKVTAAAGQYLGSCICPGSTGTGLTTYSWQ